MENLNTTKKDTHRTTVSCLNDQAQIGREGTAIRSSRSFLIGIRRWQVIAQFTRSLEVIPLIVGSIGILDFFGKSTSLVGGVRDTDKVTPGDPVERVAGGADFTVHLETPSNTVVRVY